MGDELPHVEEMTPQIMISHAGCRGGGIAVLISKSLAPNVTFQRLSYISLEAITVIVVLRKLPT